MQKVKPRKNGRDIITHEQLQKMLHVTCCVRLHACLHVVGSYCAKFDTSKTFELTTLKISLICSLIAEA